MADQPKESTATTGAVSLRFQQEPEPERHKAIPVGPDLFRIVADNPSRMTYHGTNTYVLTSNGRTIVIDPGPESDAHVADILAHCGQGIDAIMLTHRHYDHSGAVSQLRAASGAPVAAFGGAPALHAPPDIVVTDGDTVFGLEIIHTPGHASDHICFALPDGRLFSGDHVMAWATSVVPPPDGDMSSYIDSLDVLLRRKDTVYFPGHGPAVREPQRYVEALRGHRMRKEAAILRSLAQGPRTVSDLGATLHRHTNERLRRAAEITILAHLEKLERAGRVNQIDDLWGLA